MRSHEENIGSGGGAVVAKITTVKMGTNEDFVQLAKDIKLVSILRVF